MTGFVVEKEFTNGVPMVEVDIITETHPPNGEEWCSFPVTGIIDTGCPTCIVNRGVLPDYFFQESVPSQPFWAFSGVFENCRGAEMGLWFTKLWKDAFAVSVFEKPLGLYKTGEPFMILGRSFLQFGTLTYDGVGQKFKWVYSSPQGK